MALDVSTFDALYASHSTRLYSISRRILRDEDLAADVVQEAFVRAYQGADRILDAGPWLTTVVSREAIRRARLRDARDAPLETEGADGETFERPGLVETDPSLDPAHATVAADQLATVWGLVDDLAPDQRAVLTMVAEGRDAPEIAEALGKTANSVYVLVHRARRSVRRRYADRLYGIHGAAATCRGFRDDLLDRIEAPAKATPEFTAHFAACTTCQTIDEELRGASRALGILPLIPAPAGMGEAIRMQVTGAGAPVPGSETGAQAGSATDPTKGGTGTTTHAAVTAIPMKVVMLLVAAIAIVGAVALTQVAVSAPGMASPAATGTPAPAAVVAGPQSAPSPTASPAPSVSTPLPAPSPTASPAPSATASPAPTSAGSPAPRPTASPDTVGLMIRARPVDGWPFMLESLNLRSQGYPVLQLAFTPLDKKGRKVTGAQVRSVEQALDLEEWERDGPLLLSGKDAGRVAEIGVEVLSARWVEPFSADPFHYIRCYDLGGTRMSCRPGLRKPAGSMVIRPRNLPGRVQIRPVYVAFSGARLAAGPIPLGTKETYTLVPGKSLRIKTTTRYQRLTRRYNGYVEFLVIDLATLYPNGEIPPAPMWP